MAPSHHSGSDTVALSLCIIPYLLGELAKRHAHWILSPRSLRNPVSSGPWTIKHKRRYMERTPQDHPGLVLRENVTVLSLRARRVDKWPPALWWAGFGMMGRPKQVTYGPCKGIKRA